MSVRLGPNQYGKAETRVVRVRRDSARHEIRDLSVSTALRGRFEDAHVTGDQRDVLPTDSQKNTVFAFAREQGVSAVEDFGLTLADHFVATVPAADGARVAIEEYPWERIDMAGPDHHHGHDHAFVRTGGGVRITVVDVEGTGLDRLVQVVSGITDLTVLKSSGSEFHGFLTDDYTTLPETDDRILATSLVARWRYDPQAVARGIEWDATYDAVKGLLLRQFAGIHSLAMQHTLHGMGKAVLEQHPEVAEIRFAAPNKHHFLVDLSPFGLDNPGEVFHAADRPYGLIEASVVRDEAPGQGRAWHGAWSG